VIEHLPGKREALSSNTPILPKKKKKKVEEARHKSLHTVFLHLYENLEAGHGGVYLYSQLLRRQAGG
jgi:hypothetical protein